MTPKGHYELFRLKTFANYPTSAPISALVLASFGFVYTGEGRNEDDSVTCAFCNAVKKGWRPEDDVEEVHRRISPACPLMSGSSAGNVPMSNHSAQSFQEILNTLRTLQVESDSRSSHDNSHSANQAVNNSPTHPEARVTGNENNPRQRELPQATSLNNIPAAQNVMAPNSNISRSATANGSQAHSTNVTNSSQPATATTNPSISRTQTSPQATVSRNAPEPPSTNTTQLPGQNQNTTSSANGPTYSDLGIVTDRPKRPEYALKSERLKTFSSWPRQHQLQPTELADAGFYYAGYGDCARCFYCGGGLRNWEDEDDVWVEHARWFSKCSFIRQRLGQVFVDAVQELNKTLDKIPYSAVTNEIGADAFSAYQNDVREDTLKKDPAVRSVVEMGFPLAEVLEMARLLKAEEGILSADKLLLKLRGERRDQFPVLRDITNHEQSVGETNEDLENIRQLKESNNVLRQQTACKICMDKEVEIVFLPCGHLVSCTECASAMRDCPVCRKNVKGTVRAFVG